jgi:hypothetical protein
VESAAGARFAALDGGLEERIGLVVDTRYHVL